MSYGSPDGIRTHTGRILSPLSLPLDYEAIWRLGDRMTPLLDVLIGKIHFTHQPRIDYFRFVLRLSSRQPRLSVSSVYPINFYTQHSHFDDIASNFRRLNRPTEFIFVSTLLRLRLSVISVGSNHYTF